MRARSGRAATLITLLGMGSGSGLESGCAGSTPLPEANPRPEPFRSDTGSQNPTTYPSDPPLDLSSDSVLIRGGTVMTAAGDIYAPGYVHVEKGRIQAVGAGLGPKATEGIRILEANGKYVTPGLIDTHSHMGVYSFPEVSAHEDGNEATSPLTPEVQAEHGFWPQDPSLFRALAGGVTVVQVLPGSANLIGGRSFVAQLIPRTSARAMRFPGAPPGLKMACGENPKRVYGEQGGPQTRMGNIARLRAAFQSAVEYRRQWAEYRTEREESDTDTVPSPPDRDLGLETLVGVLSGEILVHNHCYRADEMHLMLDLAHEFGFSIRSFHHALEAYKLADRLAREEVAVSTWADWWGFKMEALDGVPYNAALISAAGGRAVIHSDSADDVQRLNQEAAKAMTSGRRLGIEIDPNEALRWITANPAWALGVEKNVGTLEAGKLAHVVIWSGSPFSVYSHVDQTLINGYSVYQRGDSPFSDFEVGLSPEAAVP